MPILHVASPKLDMETKDQIAAKAYECIVRVLELPPVHRVKIYFDECDSIYENGKVLDEIQLDITFDGPILIPEKIDALSKGLYEIATSAIKKKLNVIFSHRGSEFDHVSVDGVLISDIIKGN